MYFYYVLFENVIFEGFFAFFFHYFLLCYFLFRDLHFVMIFPHQYLFIDI
jgi:hypothetical protein